jgi:hypothetical protein
LNWLSHFILCLYNETDWTVDTRASARLNTGKRTTVVNRSR